MSVLLDGTTRVLVQGITGNAGRYHALEMQRLGTNVVAGVSPSRGGERVGGIPVFDTVSEAVEAHQPDLSLVLIPAVLAKDAALEAISEGVETVIIVAEGVPVHDSVELIAAARQRGCRLCWDPTRRGSSALARPRPGSCPSTPSLPAPSASSPEAAPSPTRRPAS